MQLELPLPSMESLARGDFEKCAWCKTAFPVIDDRMQRVRGLNGKFYCGPVHASAEGLMWGLK